jgi:hypothetical protein
MQVLDEMPAGRVRSGDSDSVSTRDRTLPPAATAPVDKSAEQRVGFVTERNAHTRPGALNIEYFSSPAASAAGGPIERKAIPGVLSS